jgi:hypothetical protein
MTTQAERREMAGLIERSENEQEDQRQELARLILSAALEKVATLGFTPMLQLNGTMGKRAVLITQIRFVRL